MLLDTRGRAGCSSALRASISSRRSVLLSDPQSKKLEAPASNGLTGGFDAVVWIRLEVVNVFSTLHQNGASEDASPTCPHRITTRIGDPQNSGSIAVSTRGTVQVQVSTPTITIPDGSSSEVILHCNLRAHYKPDPGTLLLPEPIHGELQASVSIEQSPSLRTASDSSKRR